MHLQLHSGLMYFSNVQEVTNPIIISDYFQEKAEIDGPARQWSWYVTLWSVW